ncbi:MAG: hypothetical protein J7L35_01665 [Anaerolineales bacterium]|nr:hypothetical protein [Anaerolineales bacterium]
MTRSFNKQGYGFLQGNRILSILLLLTLIIAGCNPQSLTASPSPAVSGPAIPDLDLPIDNRDFLVGTAGLIPPHFPNSAEEDYLEFLSEVPHTGEVLGVYMDWAAPDVIESIKFANTYAGGLTPVVALGFDFEIVNDTYFSRNLPGIRNTIREVLGNFDLEYLAFGVEANRLIPEVSQAAWLDYVTAYREVYDLVKFHSPDTKVFPIFQLEYLKGAAMLSGLEIEPHWEVLDDFESKLDLVGLTIYPFLEYTSVTEIPPDYYDDIPEKIDLPIAITEMAWLSEDVSIVQGSEEAQVEFLLGILDATRDWELEMMLYSFLYEPSGVDLFASAALNTTEGEAKEVYLYWLALTALE